MNLLRKYVHWLHTQWPAGHVEKLPVTDEVGRTSVDGLFVAGDLRGIPLLKFAADSGARAVRTIADEINGTGRRDGDVVDVAIVGAGVAGMAAALEARALGLTYRLYEANEPFSTLVNFPKGKPIYTYPKDMTPAGQLRVSADVKEGLIEELRRQTIEGGAVEVEPHRVERVRKRGDRFELVLADGAPAAAARRVVVAVGRSGNFRRLGVPGEELDKVYNRLHDPQDFCDKKILVVGGGDSAMETAIALARCGGDVIISYRRDSFVRPKPENVRMVLALADDPGADAAVVDPASERVTTAAGDFIEERKPRGRVRLLMESRVKEIRHGAVTIQKADGGEEVIDNDVVFSMIGREPPLDFFRRSRVTIRGEWTKRKVAAFAGFLVFCVLMYNWKSGGQLSDWFYRNRWWPVSIQDTFAAAAQSPASIVGVLVRSASTPSFWYTLAYSLLVVGFGVRRIRLRRTPYITVQTLVLMTIQVFPLFLLPEILLPWLGNNGWLPQGFLDALFPAVDYGNGREYWRAYGFVLAWPLNVYNVFTDQPFRWWLLISFVQTFVAIPIAIYYWGKGAYCGWVCSCGALAETLGDGQRAKMPHGAAWNRVNVFGQAVLLVAVVLLAFRIVGWYQPAGTGVNAYFHVALDRYKWIVDVFLAGIVGYGFYFWFSGRVWCRFMCPLAALMHIYARFSRFRIFAEKKKCISCNICTAVCHQGIDIMNFANKGLPMNDPECVRCSACVQSCPTGVLQFGRVGRRGEAAILDRLAASPVRTREG
jgi:NosR/NirI family nitrous oxide reductase transcriptional regulator